MKPALIFVLGMVAGWIFRGLAELIQKKVWKNKGGKQ